MRSLSCVFCLSGSKPRTRTSPAVRWRMPSRISTVVVLPAPLGPSRPKTSPVRLRNRCRGRLRSCRKICGVRGRRWLRRRSFGLLSENNGQRPWFVPISDEWSNYASDLVAISAVTMATNSSSGMAPRSPRLRWRTATLAVLPRARR